MKLIKQYCVKCDSIRSTVTRPHKTFAMLHCRVCGEEICRATDIHRVPYYREVQGDIDIRDASDACLEAYGVGGATRGHPSLLSTEQSLWPARDEEAEQAKEIKIKKFAKTFDSFTPRQRQIVLAVQECGSQERAAKLLGIDPGTVRSTMARVRKKCQRFG